MELMILLLGYSICRSSIAVEFLPSIPPKIRTKSIKPLYLLQQEEQLSPYWDDAIDKYFDRPFNNEFDNMTYPFYHRNYTIQKSQPKNGIYYIDKKNRFVRKRQKEILVRFQHLTIQQSESFYYQQLPVRSETDLKSIYTTYKAHFEAKYPTEYSLTLNFVQNSMQTNIQRYINNYQNLVNNLISSLHVGLQKIIGNHWGERLHSKHPYFFLIGSAGTGKSFIIHLITNSLTNKKTEYLLMAPTGVAAQNKLRQIKAIIIEEVSMVSSTLLSLISSLFAKINKSLVPFGEISTLLIGDIAQLPPVSGKQVFYASEWQEFFPLFLTTSHRQQDRSFYNILEEMQIGSISSEIRRLIDEKVQSYQTNNVMLTNTTYIFGFCQTADSINNLICECIPKEYDKQFRHYTNLPSELIIREGARIKIK
ncbi:hypothetical protein C1646_759413 [Rhizophagus diaphanus]|nr:hypothetical protein C1646_759413 [Rhizophagus diaphanus] [Rhizophagus sp. MUCL 43196]